MCEIEMYIKEYFYVLESNFFYFVRDTVDSIRSTLYLLKTYKSYGDVVKGAIALGNDTDITAAIAGGLAAVAYRDIPDIWIQKLRGQDMLEVLFMQLESGKTEKWRLALLWERYMKHGRLSEAFRK